MIDRRNKRKEMKMTKGWMEERKERKERGKTGGKNKIEGRIKGKENRE